MSQAQRPVRFVLSAYVCIALPTMLMIFILNGLGFRVSDELMQDIGPKWLFLMITIGFSPLFETLLMIPMLALMQRITKRKNLVCLGSAAIWAGLHALTDPIWGASVFWLFVVLSHTFLTWRERSLSAAYWVTATIHALNNTIPAIIIAFTSR
ncbi:MAG: hypothetical protein JNM52_04820 [Betaproteobacteria bacterium]|nr:hypothetical protein [Betaproteobacteria bacterium]